MKSLILYSTLDANAVNRSALSGHFYTTHHMPDGRALYIRSEQVEGEPVDALAKASKLPHEIVLNTIPLPE